MDVWKRFLTTGTAATVALALVIGPSAVAVADPGGRGSHPGHSDRGYETARRGDQGSRGDRSSNESRGDGARRSEQDGARRNTSRRSESTSAGSQQSTARGTGSAATSTDQATGGTSRPNASVSGDSAAAPITAPTARTSGTAGSDDSTGGGSYPRRAVSEVPAEPGLPRLTAAGDESAEPAELLTRPRISRVNTGVDVTVAPTPAALPDPEPLSPRQAAPLRLARLNLPVAPLGSDTRPGQPMTSLFGILGLLLIPLAGAALGYRQARAARAVGALPRT